MGSVLVFQNRQLPECVATSCLLMFPKFDFYSNTNIRLYSQFDVTNCLFTTFTAEMASLAFQWYTFTPFFYLYLIQCINEKMVFFFLLL